MAQDYDSFLDNFVAQRSNSEVGSVVTQTADDDPDRAARALELSRSSGVPAEAIYPNLDQFETQHKAVLNSDVIMGNPHLQDVLNSRPMAAKVSGDDIGPLDEAIRAVRNFVGGPWHPNPEKYALDPDERVHDQQDRAFNKGYWEGFGDQPIGDWINWKTVDGKAVRNTDFAQGYPVSTALITGGLAVPEFMLRGFNGIIHGATEYMYKRIQEGADSVGLNGDLLA